MLGDDITTDHISPAGAIPATSEAGSYLVARGNDGDDLNVFASRRGNWEAMVRDLFTNKAVRNRIVDGLAPGTTLHVPSGEVMPLWQAAERYRAEGRSVVIVAGERYGMGSSRDWAAKGVALLGVRAVLATSFERIHRSNLIGMGILPLRLPSGTKPEALRLVAGDLIEVDAHADTISPRGTVPIRLLRMSGAAEPMQAIAAIETASEKETLIAGGLLPQIIVRFSQVPHGRRL